MTSIFIASSLEGQGYAEFVASILSEERIIVRPWWSERSFPIGRSLIDALTDLVHKVDAALIVATPDDHTTRRGQSTFTAAHNVILEYGLFAGHLGRANVAILEVGKPGLPSDLDGLTNLRVRLIRDDEDPVNYRTIELKPRLVSWLTQVEASSSDGARVTRLVDMLEPGLGPVDRIELKRNILKAHVDVDALPMLPPATLEHLILKYTSYSESEAPVGYDYRSVINSYINLAEVPVGSEDESALAGHLARYLAALSVSGQVNPTLVAVSKTATHGVLQSAARMLPYPSVLVSPKGPNPKRPVEGFYEFGDRAVLLHDVALSGHHLVDCVVSLRSVGIKCNDLVALTCHQAGTRELDILMRTNQINVRTASAFIPHEGRVVCGDLKLSDLLGMRRDCVLCDVLEDNNAPIRSFLSVDELPSERLIEERNFVAVADVAPLAAGHMLIMTKQHVMAMSKLTRDCLTEVENLRVELYERLGTIYRSPVIAFEHGLCNRARSAGCGIDHAHLHVLPTRVDVEATFRKDFQVRELPQLGELNDIACAHDEYLLYVSPSGRPMIAFPDAPVRQYFRRKVADAHGRELWNWNDEVLLGQAARAKELIMNLHRSWNEVSGPRTTLTP